MGFRVGGSGSSRFRIESRGLAESLHRRMQRI